MELLFIIIDPTIPLLGDSLTKLHPSNQIWLVSWNILHRVRLFLNSSIDREGFPLPCLIAEGYAQYIDLFEIHKDLRLKPFVFREDQHGILKRIAAHTDQCHN